MLEVMHRLHFCTSRKTNTPGTFASAIALVVSAAHDNSSDLGGKEARYPLGELPKDIL
jgi:hypothetical protein